MAMTGQWQPKIGVVSLFAASSEETSGFADVADTFADGADTSTSIEIRVSQLSIENEPNYHPRADSPSEVNEDGPQTVLTPTSSISGSHQDWCEQLEAFLTDAGTSRDFESEPSSTSSIDGYASEGTDLPLTEPQTPCPRRTDNINIADLPSEIATNIRAGNDTGVRRLLFTGNTTQRRNRNRQPTQTTPQIKKQSALDALRAIERGSPPHKWTPEERLALCVLFRFWEREDGINIAKVFNQLCGLELPSHRITRQFEDHVRLYGHEVFPFYADVFNCPLDDPEDKFLHIRVQIEEAASAIGITLRRKTIDNIVPAGRAARAKAERTRRNFRDLVRRAQAHTSTETTLQPQTPPTTTSVTLPNNTTSVQIGGFALSTSQDEEEVEVNVNIDEDVSTSELSTPTSTGSSPGSSPGNNQLHHLALRVWDNESRTVFCPERGFISDLHSIWRGPSLPPPNPETEDGRNCQMLLSNIHLNKKGNASAYVSVATSLVQVLNYATNKLSETLQIAVIDISHPCLQEPHKKLRASAALKELKSLGQAQWARYKGFAEIMIWADVPIDAVVFHGSLSEVATKITSNTSGRFLFDPEDWRPDQPVSILTRKLKARNLTLDRDLARTCGIFGKEIGLADTKAKLDHITEFVQCLVDGWSFNCHLMEDIHIRSSIASSFSIALNAKALMLQDVMAAFITGVERGVENVAYYSRRRPRPQREDAV